MKKRTSIQSCYFLALFICIFSCSSLQSDTNKKEGNERPRWINDVMSECSDTYDLCAVGEGLSRNEAEANARRAIALIFEAKIQGKSSFNKSTYSQSNDSNISGGVNENTARELEEITDGLVSGASIKKSYQDKNSYYALASLDKITAKKELKSKIDSIDEKLTALSKDSSGGNFSQMRKLDDLRERVNARYQIVGGQSVPRVVTYEKILEKKQQAKDANLVVLLKISSADGLKELLPLINKILHGKNYSTVKPKKEGMPEHSVALTGSLSNEEQFLNVPGFVSYKFTLSLYFQDADGKKVHTTETSVTNNGRNYQQAYEKSLKQLKEFLTSEWEDLSIN
ncbi:MAG: LPP20 family lipoprotein [Oligoflexia bacterium]|nr:LPP20 family lipoprotein [Oligoflexia bacterium]MBF0365084.1 LPP20 family lipoprotein [Oligoflexia bacterium]